MNINKSPDKIKQMFNNIAFEYDKNNNFISLGLHNIVKYFVVKSLDIKQNSVVYDLCCGTGDITCLLYKLYENINLTGFDFSENMLKIAKERHPKLKFIQSDITNLPVNNNSSDFITIAFGLRNIQYRNLAIKEIYRILRPKGKIMHLDFGEHNLISKTFDIIVKFYLNIVTTNKNSYEYLLNSKKYFPIPKQLIEEFEKEGFNFLERKDYLFGIISMQIFEKK